MPFGGTNPSMWNAQFTSLLAHMRVPRATACTPILKNEHIYLRYGDRRQPNFLERPGFRCRRGGLWRRPLHSVVIPVSNLRRENSMAYSVCRYSDHPTNCGTGTLRWERRLAQDRQFFTVLRVCLCTTSIAGTRLHHPPFPPSRFIHYRPLDHLYTSYMRDLLRS